jgi:hypothetical protein
MTLVPGQKAPDGDAAIDTDAATGAATDNEANTVPAAPVAMPAIPDTVAATMLPAGADVVNGCTCNPLMVNWSAPVVDETVTDTVSDVADNTPEIPVILEPVM